jgi:outer membrane murein-binding lipoprotein Lpp
MGASDPRDGDSAIRRLTELTDQVRRLALDVQALREEVQVGYDESGDPSQL